MSDNELVETLRRLASKNPALNDTLHLFSLRQRARFIVTLSALQSRMAEEGFKHSGAEYAEVLKILSECGIGRLDKDPKGRIRSLKDIKVSIPALGKAVLAGERVRGFRQRARYVPVTPRAPEPVSRAIAPAAAPEARPERRPRPYQVPGSKVVATVIGEAGQVVANVSFSPNATEKDIADFFKRQLEGIKA